MTGMVGMLLYMLIVLTVSAIAIYAVVLFYRILAQVALSLVEMNATLAKIHAALADQR